MIAPGEKLDAGSQQLVIDFLTDPVTYGLASGSSVVVHETHVSIIFLAGDRAYKMKKQVRFPYLDFSSLEERHRACDAEVAINRRTAPDLYLGTVAVTRDDDGKVHLGGSGRAVEWLVEMRRFDADGLFVDMAVAGKLGRRLMENLADRIAEFHDSAEIEYERWHRDRVAAIIDNNDSSLRNHVPSVFDGDAVAAMRERAHDLLSGITDLIDARAKNGRARHCHGDLHLGNICLWDGAPTLFDGIEFSERLSHIDVLYDLAFLIMDLDHRGHRRLASMVLNRYLDRTPMDGDDVAGLAALPLFLAMRAVVRSHVSAAQGLVDEAQAYFKRALSYFELSEPRIVAVGGLSGSGKSRLARELAPFFGAAPGARIVRSDVTRKRLAGIDIMDRLGAEFYTADHSRLTYVASFAEIRSAVKAGRSAIFDAVQSKPEERLQVEALAVDIGVPFTGVWVTAPLDVRLERVQSRKANVSDVTADVARGQEDFDLGAVTWATVDSSGTRQETLTQGLAVLGIPHNGVS